MFAWTYCSGDFLWGANRLLRNMILYGSKLTKKERPQVYMAIFEKILYKHAIIVI